MYEHIFLFKGNKKPIYKNYLSSIKNNVSTSIMRKNKIYCKSKNYKLRLFAKTIVVFCLLLNVILITELHGIYYSMSVNTHALRTHILIFASLVSVILIIKNCVKRGLKSINVFKSLIEVFKNF